MTIRFAACLLVLAVVAFGEPPPDVRPLPPPPGAAVRTPSSPGAWDRIQDSLDRSTGRIVDEQLYQVDRFQRAGDERRGRIEPQTEFERFQEERDRTLRIDSQQQAQLEAAIRRQADSDRRVYQRLLRAGFSPTASQAMADDQALVDAAAERDRELALAEEARAAALAQPAADAARIQAVHDQRVGEINQRHDRQRARILGFAAGATTQPASL